MRPTTSPAAPAAAASRRAAAARTTRRRAARSTATRTSTAGTRTRTPSPGARATTRRSPAAEPEPGVHRALRGARCITVRAVVHRPALLLVLAALVAGVLATPASAVTVSGA